MNAHKRRSSWSRTGSEGRISDGRKALFYAGFAISGIGLLLFLSVFLSVFMGVIQAQGDRFPGDLLSDPFGKVFGFAGRAFGGMALLVIGQLMRRIGQRGMAGSGLILDPERARRDVEPWSRMAGGMLADGLDGAGIKLDSSTKDEPDFAERLRKLKALHEEGILSDEEYTREKDEALEN